MQILIVEDEKRLADVLGQLCREQRWQADVVYTGTDGLAYARSGQYDAVVLDVMLPGMDGFGVVRTLRREKVATPVLMLTARDDVRDKVTVLGSAPQLTQLAEILLDNACKYAAGGHGLGLAIAQSIAHTHRGRIKAQSAGGVTTFTVTLPLHT